MLLVAQHEQSGRDLLQPLIDDGRQIKPVASSPTRRRISVGVLFLLAVPLMVYHLDVNPRPWHDEAAAMLVSKTLVQDGVYAQKSGTEYQAFGAVQSVGPTVLVPVALSFKLFGVGIWQGRLVTACYGVLTLAFIYLLAARLFGWGTGVAAALLTLAGPQIGFLLYSRQVCGEVAALGMFLCGWLLWLVAQEKGRGGLAVAAGVMLGLAMVTKSQYVPMGLGGIGCAALADRLYYRTGSSRSLIIVGATAFLTFAAWYGFQRVYYGADVFADNMRKLGELAASVMGFRPHITAEALRFLAGSQSGAFYHFWGFAGLLYAAVVGLRRDWASFRHVPLLLITLFWWAYFVFYAVPWPQLAVAPMGVTAIFVAMLWRDALSALGIQLAGMLKDQGQEPREHRAVGIALACVMGLTVVVPLERQIRTNVITADRAASEVAAYIERTVESGEVVETWERELGIMTTRTCHYPDQLLTARAHAAIYHDGPRSYALGEEYFARHRAQYLVVGWFGAALGVYDPDYVREHGQRLASFGPEASRYDVYRLK